MKRLCHLEINCVKFTPANLYVYSKTYVKRPFSKRPKIGFQDQLSLDAGQEHSAVLATFIKLPFVFKNFVLSIFEWPPKAGFTVLLNINEPVHENLVINWYEQ